jgi:UDPglucose 6-dehydrogenase
MKRIKVRGINTIIFEPAYHEAEFLNSRVIKNLDEFKFQSDIIISNRMTAELFDVKSKVYTRDIFGSDT